MDQAKRVKQGAHVHTTAVCQKEDLNLGSACHCSFHYTAHVKCAQMHAHIHEQRTKNSMGSWWSPKRKGKRNQRESGKDRKKKGK